VAEDDGIRIGPDLLVPSGELRWRFDTSGGPGGQHANRSATRVELSLDVAGSPSLPDDVRRRLLDRLAGRLRHGVITVVVDDSRSQWRNRSLARRRLARLLTESLHTPRPRLPTRPSAAARQRRRRQKEHRSRLKRWRQRPEEE
jgi:ribosome-associated protein